VADIFHQQRRLWMRLHEKGGKFHEMPCHHTLEGYLAEYIERARLAEAGRAPLFQAIKYRPYGRGQAELNGERLDRINAWKMVRRRAKAAGITTQVCNDTFRGTGITAYLENGGTLEKARQMAAHASLPCPNHQFLRIGALRATALGRRRHLSGRPIAARSRAPPR